MRQAAGVVAYTLGFFATVALFLAAFVAMADPYGFNSFGISVLEKDAPRAGRAERDRLVKPLDIRNQQPKSVFLGTSRTKQAIDPTILVNTSLGPAYNAGIDRASLGEMRALLQDSIREDQNLRNVFIDLHLYQFFAGRPIGDEIRTMLPPRPGLLTSDAIAMARDTAGAAIGGQKIKHAVRADGMQTDPPVYAQPTTWAHAYFKTWKDRDFTVELNEAAFGQLKEISDICTAARIRCVFYIAPISPPVMAALYLSGSLDIFFDWKRRLAAFGGVADFALPYLPFWETGRGSVPLTYWADTSHFSIKGGELIVSALRQYSEGHGIKPGVMLTEEEVQRQTTEWPALVAAYLAADPSLEAAYRSYTQ